MTPGAAAYQGDHQGPDLWLTCSDEFDGNTYTCEVNPECHDRLDDPACAPPPECRPSEPGFVTCTLPDEPPHPETGPPPHDEYADHITLDCRDGPDPDTMTCDVNPACHDRFEEWQCTPPPECHPAGPGTLECELPPKDVPPGHEHPPPPQGEESHAYCEPVEETREAVVLRCTLPPECGDRHDAPECELPPECETDGEGAFRCTLHHEVMEHHEDAHREGPACEPVIGEPGVFWCTPPESCEGRLGESPECTPPPECTPNGDGSFTCRPPKDALANLPDHPEPPREEGGECEPVSENVVRCTPPPFCEDRIGETPDCTPPPECTPNEDGSFTCTLPKHEAMPDPDAEPVPLPDDGEDALVDPRAEARALESAHDEVVTLIEEAMQSFRSKIAWQLRAEYDAGIETVKAEYQAGREAAREAYRACRLAIDADASSDAAKAARDACRDEAVVALDALKADALRARDALRDRVKDVAAEAQRTTCRTLIEDLRMELAAHGFPDTPLTDVIPPHLLGPCEAELNAGAAAHVAATSAAWGNDS